MNTERQSELVHREITEKVIKAFFDVHRELGHGFLESIYENALALVLQSEGLLVERQKPVTVSFRGQEIGEFRLDLVVGGFVVVEVKAVSTLNKAHEAQLLNYLKATGLHVGLVLNFGPKAEFSRRVL
ncbi:MAG TPA: GxxExxY protein [Solimonas sp.]|nr:GxxExxY protein [Solimonas sp.]